MLLIALIIACSQRVCCLCQCLGTGRQPDYINDIFLYIIYINMLLIALIITYSQRVCCLCQCLGRQPELTAVERGHRTSLLVSLLCIIIMITWPKPRYVRQGLASGIVGPGYSSLKQVYFGPSSTSRFLPLALSSNWIFSQGGPI